MEPIVQPKVLLVDDEPSHLDIVADLLCQDYQISVTTSGEEALKLASEDRFDAIILDIVMPEMDGFTVCSKLLSRDHFLTPIIFLTSNDSSNHIERGLELGAAYYLTKPINPKRIKAVIKTATEHSKSLFEVEDRFSSAINTHALLDNAQFNFKTLSEAKSLAYLFSEICPSPDAVRMGLTELLINAIEHGNLGITYEEKSALNEEGIWEEEVTRRLSDPTLALKTATLNVLQDQELITFTITDQGDGFEWEKYLSFDPERALHSHGRGIAMANMIGFDSLKYFGNGNTVTTTIKKQ